MKKAQIDAPHHHGTDKQIRKSLKRERKDNPKGNLYNESDPRPGAGKRAERKNEETFITNEFDRLNAEAAKKEKKKKKKRAGTGNHPLNK